MSRATAHRRCARIVLRRFSIHLQTRSHFDSGADIHGDICNITAADIHSRTSPSRRAGTVWRARKQLIGTGHNAAKLEPPAIWIRRQIGKV